ncbi:MAG: cellulase family glycosylhydrolase [Cyclobacteriaceae bacterium]|nr:cellulase family glycosylhydrolase [Cyclobacteriaceae bacterium]
MKNTRVVICLLVCLSTIGFSQRTTDAYVDKNGVLRWGNSKEEIKGFGVNYTVPFAHAYRTAKRLGVDIEKAIDEDVYHFARLGFDLYRVHVWDTQISDSVGNLLTNEHLHTFDYMIKKMKERGMKFIITPIAFWGDGWPEPDGKTPGFSHKYGKDACLTHPEAIAAQRNYLYQFLNHVNPLTGVAYKNDPDIIAFEVSNEPHHRESAEAVTGFINSMVDAMRSTGCKKPVFYNVTHSIQLADAYFKSKIQGGTYQWYPTGLGARHELGGNLLPHVDHYSIPFSTHPSFKSSARIVYEFDAADVGRSYIYPAMARSFREAGMQLATHFSYDPTYMAYTNTEYGTHYMNLAYTPQKALSLMIASEVFHQVPMFKSFGRYPSNTRFGNFFVNYEDDLAEMITESSFIYTNTTSSSVPDATKLKRIAGSGNSSVVSYDGTGAYFLDQLEPGVWRLEVMPDVCWIDDPFTRTSLKKEIAVIQWNQRTLTVNLPDIGSQYSIIGVNTGNSMKLESVDRSMEVLPGTYIILRKGKTTSYTGLTRWKNIVVGEFTAPQATVKQNYVQHKPVEQLTEVEAVTISADIVSPSVPGSVELHVWSGYRREIISMDRLRGYTYQATIPSEMITKGFLSYFISITNDNISHTFPSGEKTYPTDWDFYVADQAYRIPVVSKGSAIFLFNAATDNDRLLRQWVRESSLVPTGHPGKAELLITINKLFRDDPEDKLRKPVYDYSMRFYTGHKTTGRAADIKQVNDIIFNGYALNGKPCKLQVALVTKDGRAYGAILSIEPDKKEYKVSLNQLVPVPLVTLPRPYPTFLPYYFTMDVKSSLDISAVESIQLSIGPGIPIEVLTEQHGIAIESIRLE